MVNNFQVERLTKDNVCQYAAEMEKLDRDIFIELGGIYGNDHWGEDNFSKDYRRKWEGSYIARDSSGKKCLGFIIVSEQIAGEIHIHRLAVAQKARSTGLGRELLKRVDEYILKSGLHKITVEVNRENTVAVDFYRRNGYDTLEGEGLKDYAQKRKIGDIKVLGDCLEEYGGYQAHILFKTRQKASR